MAHVKNGYLAKPPEWWKHLRWTKRCFWKRQRTAEKKEVGSALEMRRGNRLLE